MPGAFVATRRSRRTAPGVVRCLTVDRAALRRVPERVVDEVAQHLLDAVEVGAHARVAACGRPRSCMTRLLRAHREHVARRAPAARTRARPPTSMRCCPDSMRERSSSSPTRCSSRRDSTSMTRAARARSSGVSSVPSCIACEKPRIDVSGVFSSCETFARNSRSARCDACTESAIAFTSVGQRAHLARAGDRHALADSRRAPRRGCRASRCPSAGRATPRAPARRPAPRRAPISPGEDQPLPQSPCTRPARPIAAAPRRSRRCPPAAAARPRHRHGDVQQRLAVRPSCASARPAVRSSARAAGGGGTSKCSFEQRVVADRLADDVALGCRAAAR